MIRPEKTVQVKECPFCGSRKGFTEQGICLHCMADTTAVAEASNDTKTTKMRRG